MGYLVLPTGLPNFGKAIISLWFKVSPASIAAATAAYLPPSLVSPPANYAPPPPLNGIIPLIVFGGRYSSNLVYAETNSTPYTVQDMLITSGTGFCNPVEISSFMDSFDSTFSDYSSTFTSNPSFVGIDCKTGTGYLAANLQTGAFPSMSGTLFSDTVTGPSIVQYLNSASYMFDINGHLCSNVVQKNDGVGNPQFVLNTPYDSTSTYADQSSLQANAQPEFFGATSQTIAITPGVWHHLLISFNLVGNMSATGSYVTPISPSGPWSSDASMWVALDDINYNGNDLPAWGYPAGIVPSNPNTIMSKRMYDTAILVSVPEMPFDGASGNYFWDRTSVSGGPSRSGIYDLSLDVNAIESAGNPVAIPASPDLVGDIYDVIMAELQVYTGVTTDTSVTGNRRLFVSPTGHPVSYTVAQSVFGTPKIALVKNSKNWQRGMNLGSGGIFNPTGTITPYTPGP